MKSIIVLDLETQRLMQDARRYAWLSIDTKTAKPQLRGDITGNDILESPREVRPRKLAPWFSLLPKPIIDVPALTEHVLENSRESGVRRGWDYFILYDPHWRDIDMAGPRDFSPTRYYERPFQIGSPIFNRRLGLAVAVTWDAKHGFREWWEGQAADLVQELCQHRAIVGANLVNFDYCVLERYVPDVRRRLGFRTVDILAHARWGLFLNFIESQLCKQKKRPSRTAVEQIARRFRLYPANPRSWADYELDPDFWLVVPGERNVSIRRHAVSLARLAKGTLNARKLGKAANAPALFAQRKYKELVAYCQQDVRLTRDIFFAGCKYGAVSVSKTRAPVRWKELVERLMVLRRKEGPIDEERCLSFQYDLLLEETPFSVVEALFRLQRGKTQ